MLFALGAVSSALDALRSLTSSKSSSTQQTGFTQGATNPFAIGSGTSTPSGATSSVNSPNRPQISPETMSALISAQGQSSASASNSTSSTSSMNRQDALKDLFSRIDADGDGKITQSEFENALGAGGTNLAQADDVFSKLDANSDHSVSLNEMSKALKGGHRGRHHAQSSSGAGDAGGSGSGSTQASGGSTSASVTNSDGSTTTTVTYADGFKISTTVPGASSANNSPYDWFAQMMQRGSQAQSTSAASSVSMSV
jgi:EF hand domain-containing protein